MIRCLLLDRDGVLRDGGEELVDEWRRDAHALVWVDTTEEPAERERDLLARWFGLHPLGLQDAQRQRHPPKVEPFRDHTFLLLRGLDADSHTVDFGTIQLAMFVGERFLATRHSGPSVSVERLRAELIEDPALLRRGADAVTMRLCRLLVDRYMPILLGVEDRLEELERLMLELPRDEQLAELVTIKARMRKLRRIMTYHVDVFGSLRKADFSGISATVMHELVDVLDNLERAKSLATLYQEIAADLMDGYLSVSSHRLNHVMKILTVVTTVFVPLGFLAGVYGMNFELMPELKWPWAYFALLSVMAGIATTSLWVFWRRGWLRPA